MTNYLKRKEKTVAIKPKQQELKATSVDILNSIRGQASQFYRSMIPRATQDTESIRQIGNVMMQYQPLQNEFLTTLYNRIGRVIITSKMYYNPLVSFKKGLMEMGETAEEIFVNIAKVHTFNQEKAETNWMKREIPDVRAAFHPMNYQKFYKATISNDQLRQAFLSWDGITDLIARIVNAMYTAHNYDEFTVTKYMIARTILNGGFYGVTVPAITAANATEVVTEIKTVSNNLTYESSAYNPAGVYTFSDKNDQYLITTGRVDAIIDVNVLAVSFNMTKAEFMGHMIQIDGFDKLDEARLEMLFGDDPASGYVPFTQEEKEALAAIPAVIVDKDFFMIFDNLYKFTEDYNGEGLYWQYWYHAWKTFSVSPFANAVAFLPGDQTVTAVNVSPATATVKKGDSIGFIASVTGSNFPSKGVIWTQDSPHSSINQSGVLNISPNETNATINVTATSIFDPTKSGTAVITVEEPAAN